MDDDEGMASLAFRSCTTSVTDRVHPHPSQREEKN